jgi:hypothetical protein
MYAVLTTPDVVALVDSDNRWNWAEFGTSGTSTDTAELWRDRLNAGTYSRDALVWTLMSDHAYKADLSPVVPVDPRIAELESTVESLRDTVRRLSNEQIDGSDSRLEDFWRKAHDAATRADHCQIFDQLCEELNGPSRRVEVDVTVTLTHVFTAMMSRTDYDDGDYSNIDPSDYIDRYSIDVSEVEIESVELA